MRVSSKRLIVRFVVAVLATAAAAPAAAHPLEVPQRPVLRGALACPQTSDPGRLAGCPGDFVANKRAKPLASIDALRPPKDDPNIVLISSGIATSVLPEPLRPLVKGITSQDTTDPIGYGSFLASIVLQLVPHAHITSLSGYDATGLVSSYAIRGAFDTAAAMAKDGAVDAVLFGMPPSELLDPIFAMMVRKQWDGIVNASEGRPPTPVKGGHMFGVALGGGSTSFIGNIPTVSAAGAKEYQDLSSVWSILLTKINLLDARGIPIVVPAGDVNQGMKPEDLQTIFGIANLPQVLTVGASDGATVPAQSARGPAFDVKNEGWTDPAPQNTNGFKALRVKPDIVAPSGVVGLLPSNSLLGKALGDAGLLNAALKPLWKDTLETPPDAARASLASTLPSAAVVAVQAAALHAKGIDPTSIRGAFNTTAERLPGVPVWQQGAGDLRSYPDSLYDASADPTRPLVLDHGDTAVDAANGTSAAMIRIQNGTPDQLVTLEVTDVATIGIDGPTVEQVQGIAAEAVPHIAACATHPEGAVQPPPTGGHHHDHNGCIHIHVSPAATDSEGYFCGFLAVHFGATSVPTPVCWIKGMSLTAHATYLGGSDADALTFGLVPTVPIGSAFEHWIAMIPSQQSLELYFLMTDKAGNANFKFVLPGFYDIRLFSDYGAPTRVVPGQAVGTTEATETTTEVDLGDRMIYQSLGQDALVLPDTLCPKVKRPDCAPGFSSANYDASTGTYKGRFLTENIRYVFGNVEKSPGPAVSSRSIDLVKCRDLFNSDPDVLASYAPGSTFPHTSAWTINRESCDPATAPKTDAEKKAALSAPFSATFAGALPGKSPFLVLEYPFRLVSPNYRYHLSLDFSYALKNALMLVEVIGGSGPDKIAGLVTANGTVVVNGTTIQSLIKGNVPSGSNIAFNVGSDKKAHFDFTRITQNQSCRCVVRLSFIPKGGADATLPAQIQVRDIAFALDTWVAWRWSGAVGGSNASVVAVPNYRKDAYADGCRSVPTPTEKIADGRSGPQLCEDWVMMAHVPTQRAVMTDTYACGTDATCGSPRSVGAALGVSETFYDQQMIQNPPPAHYPVFGQHEEGFFGHSFTFIPETVDVTKATHCVTSGRGKFWRQISIRGAGLSKAGIAENETLSFGIKFVAPGTETVSQPATAKKAGAVEIGEYYPLAEPAGESITIAAPPNRLLLILGLIAATIAAAILTQRRRRRWARP
ncbi:MAG: hypothetical protein ABR548_11680 [Actinomycetota bacterium]|nr:hypothetical protein [Actinomycetota bacterium]